jgi:hypothetical protein
MTAPFAADTTLSGGVIAAVIALALIALALVTAAIVDIVRRPAVLGGQKWVWILVVLLFDLIGPIVYFAIGRVAPPAADDDEEGPQGATSDRAAAAADLLYGPGAAGPGQGDETPPLRPPA